MLCSACKYNCQWFQILVCLFLIRVFAKIRYSKRQSYSKNIFNPCRALALNQNAILGAIYCNSSVRSVRHWWRFSPVPWSAVIGKFYCISKTHYFRIKHVRPRSPKRRRRTVPDPRKSPNNFTSTFYNIVHLSPKSLSFEYGGAKLVSCLGRHLTSVYVPEQKFCMAASRTRWWLCFFLKRNVLKWAEIQHLAETSK